MIVQLTPDIKFVCDRCGKEEFPNEKGELVLHPEVMFSETGAIMTKSKRKKGEVCADCLAEFWEFAENFFDEVNKDGGVKNED
jgi:hypothetical protein